MLYYQYGLESLPAQTFGSFLFASFCCSAFDLCKGAGLVLGNSGGFPFTLPKGCSGVILLLCGHALHVRFRQLASGSR